MELTQLRTFRVVAETLNFTRAAERLGLTLVGFLRGDGFNVYARADRIAGGPAGT